jgi:integrase
MENENKMLIQNFLKKCEAEGLSEARIKKYLYTLNKINKILKKDFRKVTEEDMVDLLAKIERGYYVRKKTKEKIPFSTNTKHDYKVAIKKFWKFLGKEELVGWIKTTIRENQKQLPKIITREDLMKLLQACKTIRDKALLSVLFESGCRVGEILNLKMRDVEFDEYGAVLIVQGKTGSRRVRICNKAVEYLKEWYYVNHPTKNPDSKLFPFNYRALEKSLKKVAERANLGKEVHFHMFRHGRATELANKLTEQELDVFMGWQIGSKMPRVYCHLSGRDIERKILEISGITEYEKLDSALRKIKIKEPELYQRLLKFVYEELKQTS